MSEFTDKQWVDIACAGCLQHGLAPTCEGQAKAIQAWLDMDECTPAVRMWWEQKLLNVQRLQRGFEEGYDMGLKN